MRLGILSQYYPPEVGAPQARLSELAEEMARRGHQVHVLTALPNYPAGRLFPGYSGAWMREARGGLTVDRGWIRPTQSPRLLPRLTAYGSFAASALALGLFRLPALDYLLVESPPIFLGPTGIMLARLRGARLIFNVSDLWPASAVELGVIREGGLAHRMASALEAACYRAAWLVTGQSQGIVADIARRFPRVPTWHLSNGVTPGRFPGESANRPAGAGVRVVYAGLHGLAQGLDQVLAAVPSLAPGVQVELVGDGPEKAALQQRAAQRGLSALTFLDQVEAAEVPGLLAGADIVLVPLRRELTGAVPSKLYEAFASARPVVLCGGGEAARIVEEAGAGLVVPPGCPEELAAAINALAVDPDRRRALGAAGRRAAEGRFNRATILAAFEQHLERGMAS